MWIVGVENVSARNLHMFSASEKARMRLQCHKDFRQCQKRKQQGSGAWEVQEEDWGMAMMMDAAEDLNPTYEEAKRRLDWPKWEEAIRAELYSLEANKMWLVVERLKDANVARQNGSSESRKIRPVRSRNIRLDSWRMDSHTRNGWPLDSFDFDSAYLNSVLSNNKILYLEQPVEFSLDKSRGQDSSMQGSGYSIYAKPCTG